MEDVNYLNGVFNNLNDIFGNLLDAYSVELYREFVIKEFTSADEYSEILDCMLEYPAEFIILMDHFKPILEERMQEELDKEVDTND